MSDEDLRAFAEEMLDLANAIEAACVKLRVNLDKLFGGEQAAGLTWDPAKIKWTRAEGAKGPFERSEDVDSQDFKAMLKDLAAHGGRLQREGLFYWVFQNGSTVGRKESQWKK